MDSYIVVQCRSDNQVIVSALTKAELQALLDNHTIDPKLIFPVTSTPTVLTDGQDSWVITKGAPAVFEPTAWTVE